VEYHKEPKTVYEGQATDLFFKDVLQVPIPYGLMLRLKHKNESRFLQTKRNEILIITSNFMSLGETSYEKAKD
jgi:hypothetical protein